MENKARFSPVYFLDRGESFCSQFVEVLKLLRWEKIPHDEVYADVYFSPCGCQMVIIDVMATITTYRLSNAPETLDDLPF